MHRQLLSHARAGLALAAAALLPSNAPVQAQSGGEIPISIHGYMTQGYARAWETPLVGIPTDGTFDYRSVALQFAYRVASGNELVLQFSHRRLGSNMLEGGQNQVRLDWGFYEREFGEGSVRVGKVPLPRGFFNEIRDVGTALPFYRAPIHFYWEAGETLDGAVLSYRIAPEQRWSVDVAAFGGAYDFDYVAYQPTGAVIETLEARSVHGFQAWLDTPLRGARFGASGMRYRQSGGDDDDSRFFNQWQLSAERVSELLTLRAEYGQAGARSYDYEVYYGQLGIRLLRALTANFQAEFADLTVDAFVGAFEIDYGRDLALGFNWNFVPSAALKVEGHSYRGFGVDRHISFAGAPAEARYLITSISFGF